MQRVEKIEQRRAAQSPRSPRVKLQWRRRVSFSENCMGIINMLQDKKKSNSPRKSPHKSPRGGSTVEKGDSVTTPVGVADEDCDEHGDTFEVIRPFSPNARPFSPSSLFEARRASVIQRRNTLMQNESELIKKAAQQWTDKVTTLEVDKEKSVSQVTKSMRWLAMLCAVNKMRVMGLMVKQFRDIKRANLSQ